jgi:mannitol 2-dehydrogenase
MPDVASGLSALIRSIETRGVATTLRRHLRGDYRELVQR